MIDGRFGQESVEMVGCPLESCRVQCASIRPPSRMWVGACVIGWHGRSLAKPNEGCPAREREREARAQTETRKQA